MFESSQLANQEPALASEFLWFGNVAASGKFWLHSENFGLPPGGPLGPLSAHKR